MIFDQSEQNLNAWKTQMHLYEKGKRTKKPFGKSMNKVEHVTHEQIKSKECLFNPILQTFRRQQDERRDQQITEEKRAKSLMNHLKQSIKYQKNFDIVNLKSNQPYAQKKPARHLGPIRNAYNVINNQKMPDFYFQNREIRLPVQREKKLLQNYKKQFDIVTNVYNQNHEERIKSEKEKEIRQANQKYTITHDYDPVYGKYYDQKREEQYQKQRINKELEHGKDVDKNLPPSYVYREPFIADYTKPLPQTLKILDQKIANTKKRYQTKYVVLDQYQKRNEEQEIKQEQIIKNHVHFGRILDEKAKQFDIVNNRPYKQTRAEELFNKKLQVQSWDILIKQASKAAVTKSAIKTSGFA